MKKSLLVTFFYPPQVGGIENSLYNFSHFLKDKEELTILVPPFKNCKEFDKQEPYKIVRKKFLNSKRWPKPRFIPLLWHTLKLVIIKKPDIIYAGQIHPLGAAAYFAKKLFGIPYIIFTYGMDVTLLHHARDKSWLSKKVFAQAEKIITISEFTKKEIMKFSVPEEKIYKLWPGVSQPEKIWNQDEARSELNLNKDDKIILTVARLMARKGHDKVISALKKVLETIPQAKYVIVGDGENKENLVKLVKENNLEDKVIFAGKVSDEDLAKYYSACDILILASRPIKDDVEGFGMVYVEANIYGKAVIGGRGGGTADAILDGKTGILVDPENEAEIADKIIEILQNDELRNKLALNGKLRAENELQWETLLSKFKQEVLDKIDE
ncbi:MAG: glycosyltransferase family 4 protein [bacterium]